MTAEPVTDLEYQRRLVVACQATVDVTCRTLLRLADEGDADGVAATVGLLILALRDRRTSELALSGRG